MNARLLPLLLATAFATCCSTHPAHFNIDTDKSSQTIAARCTDDSGWNDPVSPRRIFGNTWYVGTCAISAILITSPTGHILLDGATAEGANQIEKNIRALGFRVEDVRYILISHEHFDHVGGVAQLQVKSGAIVSARDVAADVLEHGKSDRRDPQLLQIEPFSPVANVQRIANGEQVSVGKTVVTAHATPAHTLGSMSWTWKECDKARCLNIAYVDSLTPLTDEVFRYSDENSHPGFVKAFRHSIDAVSALPCDILITPHPQASALWTRLNEPMEAGLTDSNACVRYANTASAKLTKKIAEEQLKLAP